MSFLDRILQLGEAFEVEFQHLNYDVNQFSTLAKKYLLQTNIKCPQIDEIYQLFDPEQESVYPLVNPLDPDELFGEPPLTLFRTKHFVIDLYFWFSGNTSIHTHGFRGAFKILKGDAFDAIYQTGKIDEKNAFKTVIQQKVHFHEMKYLKEGSVTEIKPMHEFIHEVGHCHQPQITLAIRTYDEKNLLQHNVLLPDIFYVESETLNYKDFKALSFIHVLVKMDKMDLAKRKYSHWLENISDTSLLAHYRKPGKFEDEKWVNYREKAIRKRTWGTAYLKAEKKRILNNIRYQKLERVDYRALAFLMQHGVHPLEFEKELRESFDLVGPIKNNIFELIKHLNDKKLLTMQLNDTAWEIFECSFHEEKIETAMNSFCSEYEEINPIELKKDFLANINHLKRHVVYQTVL